jgi:hypothetical protein
VEADLLRRPWLDADRLPASPQGDIPATNRRLKGRGCQCARVQGEKITAVDLYFDQVQVLTHLGLMPEAATTA